VPNSSSILADHRRCLKIRPLNHDIVDTAESSIGDFVIENLTRDVCNHWVWRGKIDPGARAANHGGDVLVRNEVGVFRSKRCDKRERDSSCVD
jgi:hypothetical protein